MLFIILMSTVCFLIFLHILFNFHEKARLVRSIPGPYDCFLIGNALEYLTTPVKIFGLCRKFATKWSIYRFWAFNLGAVNIFTPDDIEKIISTTKFNSKSALYRFLRPWLQDGLLLSDGEKWQQRRKILTPTFHFNILQRFCVIIEENSRRMLDVLNNSAGEKIDVVPLMSEFTLNSICETAMGTRFSEDMVDKGVSYKAAIHSIGKGLVQRASRIILYIDLIFNNTALGRKQKKIIEKVQNFTKKVIKDRKQRHTEQYGAENLDNVNSEEHNMNRKRKRTAMLDLLIQAQKENLIDDVGIQEEVDTFMFEGHDTTACGLMYCLMMLANNKDIQDKIFQELETIFNDSDRSASYDDLSQMRYLECCIKESLRLYPPVPFISRQVTESIDLGGYKIPSGIFCHIHIYDLHRREELFPDPLKYDPDRFLPENCVGRHPYAYIPFSAGPRNCIGQKFAMMELKIALSAILRHFELKPVTKPWDLHIAADLVLRNTKPIYVIFGKRNKKTKHETIKV